MNRRKPCSWMSGPRDATMKVPAGKWWLWISRDRFAKNDRHMLGAGRPPVACDRTPSFDSPISRAL